MSGHNQAFKEAQRINNADVLAKTASATLTVDELLQYEFCEINGAADVKLTYPAATTVLNGRKMHFTNIGAYRAALAVKLDGTSATTYVDVFAGTGGVTLFCQGGKFKIEG